MSRIRILATAFVCMALAGIVLTASASAVVAQIGRCKVNAGTGTKYEDSACTKAKTSGSFEWKELAGTEKSFTVSAGTTVLVGPSVVVTCKEGTGSGEVEGFTKAKGTLSLTGCEIPGGIKCKSEAGAAGEIVYALNNGFVLYTNSKGKVKVGLLVTPSTSTIACGASFKVEVRGAAIARLVSAEAFPTELVSFALTVKAGEQEIPDAENPLEVKLNGGAFGAATLESEFSWFFKEVSVVVKQT